MQRQPAARMAARAWAHQWARLPWRLLWPPAAAIACVAQHAKGLRSGGADSAAERQPMLKQSAPFADRHSTALAAFARTA